MGGVYARKLTLDHRTQWLGRQKVPNEAEGQPVRMSIGPVYCVQHLKVWFDIGVRLTYSLAVVIYRKECALRLKEACLTC
jgi:hypothetical protein